MSLPQRTGTEDVAAEEKPRGKTWQYRKEKRTWSLSIDAGERDGIGGCGSR
jgi:hypothetical protein